MSPFRGSAPFTERWQHFRFERAGPVATVTLDRPGKLNALTFEAYADLRDLLAELPHRSEIRVLVIRGEGRAFCSGGDVNEIIGATLRMGQDELLAFTRMTGEVIRNMRECPVPVIAALQGMAAGAGAVIALAGPVTPRAGASQTVPCQRGGPAAAAAGPPAPVAALTWSAGRSGRSGLPAPR